MKPTRFDYCQYLLMAHSTSLAICRKLNPRLFNIDDRTVNTLVVQIASMTQLMRQLMTQLMRSSGLAIKDNAEEGNRVLTSAYLMLT
jgi:hypothetical protein